MKLHTHAFHILYKGNVAKIIILIIRARYNSLWNYVNSYERNGVRTDNIQVVSFGATHLYLIPENIKNDTL